MPDTDIRFEKLIHDLTKAEKLDMALALQITSYMRTEVKADLRTANEELRAELSETRNEIRSNNVNNLRRIIAVENSLDAVKADLQNTRIRRADKEVEEAEMRLRLAKETKNSLTTQERIEVQRVVDEELNKADKRDDESRNTLWKKRWDSVVTAVMVTFGVSIATGVVAFIAWLINLYLQTR